MQNRQFTEIGSKWVVARSCGRGGEMEMAANESRAPFTRANENISKIIMVIVAQLLNIL